MTPNRMPVTLTLVFAAAALLLGACADVTSYSDAEAPKELIVDPAVTRVDVRFAPGSSALSAADRGQLERLAATGSIGRADRVTVAAAGAPGLAQQRIAAVAATLLHYGIVVSPAQLANVAPHHAIVEVNRGLVTLPACPNWSKSSHDDFANQPSSNFGCANETNLGLMVAYPSDLASGRTVVGGVAGEPAAAAMHRYLTDKVVLPEANTALPVAQASSPTPAPSGSP